ncbi:MAG: hypothetical protein ACTSXD_09925 [Candidatus Heimdallarchaeaceae archaeon]
MHNKLPKEILLNLLKKYEEDLKKVKTEDEKWKIKLKMSFVKKKLNEYA